MGSLVSEYMSISPTIREIHHWIIAFSSENAWLVGLFTHEKNRRVLP
jgi:hypothetical protein